MKKVRRQSELVFTPSKNNWLIPYHHGTKNSNIKEIREIYLDIMKRDNFTCHFCNFRSKRYQEIHHINHNHSDHSESNLTTICPLCHQYFHLSTCGMNSDATMIFLPEFSQEELNRLCIYIFSILNSNLEEEWKSLARDMYTKLEETKSELTQRLHSEEVCNPTFFELILLNLTKENAITKNKEFSKVVKILPKTAKFARQAKYWAKKELVDIDKWSELIPENVNIEEINAEFN